MKKMNKIVVVFVMLGLLLSTAGIVQAATLAITANVQSVLNLALNPTTMNFTDVVPGVPTDPQILTATTTGNGSYQLTLQGAAFTGPASQPASVLQFKETSASTYVSATTAAINMLASPSTATNDGDQKTFHIRLNFPAHAPNGTYSANITITAVPQ
ncbi:hypothetical protein SAMN02745221_00172 [Thermosyntropha lipolytica DSM 11003]|uniref:Uncharacterized protein n=1 Tax=Thermosyntropha lipolytica DSM 11003 TaxID=1123382 RepID=A0A1M5JPE5_9FIRM|nr:hypothetical protein [Thermosyntropha lipolytica]SHG42437.1 hypothetical protein SAMN02745221_00172 [Thermosyntropha lipolytica DSM 11003]